MKIIFDLMHPAHVNFFRNAIRILQSEGHEIVISVLDRGKVPSIVKKEFPGIRTKLIGKHRGTAFSILFQANIFRFFSMLAFLIKERPDAGFSVGSFIMGSGMKLLNRKNYQFDDDPERKINVQLEKWTSTRLFFPAIYKDSSSKVEYFNCLKEWAYLSPTWFKPEIASLEEYGLKPREYIFVREISNGSLNYKGQEGNIIAGFAKELPSDFKYVLSLEDKSTRDMYPENWILLKEPVTDIHSLMYYSSCAVSSGDSMAREAAMLGVPSVYCGFRTMKANSWMEQEGKLTCISDNVPLEITRLLSHVYIQEQESFRKQLLAKWDDVTNIILSQLK